MAVLQEVKMFSQIGVWLAVKQIVDNANDSYHPVFQVPFAQLAVAIIKVWCGDNRRIRTATMTLEQCYQVQNWVIHLSNRFRGEVQ